MTERKKEGTGKALHPSILNRTNNKEAAHGDRGKDKHHHDRHAATATARSSLSRKQVLMSVFLKEALVFLQD